LSFLIYINDLSKSVLDKSNPLLYTDDTSFIIANQDKNIFKSHTKEVFNEINKWFYSNVLMLKYDKTYFMQFVTKTDYEINMQVLFDDKRIATARNLKFLGLTIDTTLTWKHHITELPSRLNKACYAIRLIKPFMSTDVLRSTYFSYVHSIISYEIIFWRNSSHSEDIFKIKKRIIMSSGKKASCRQLFRELNILPVQSQYILSLRLLVTKNRDQFIYNSQVHAINTRQTSDFYILIANLTTYKKRCLLPRN
jgi:hypothetical protein